MSKSVKEKESFTVHDDYHSDKSLRAQSRDHFETSADDSHALKKEVDGIRLSLDALKDTLILQHYVLARDFEAKIRHVYDGVINDINGIRKQVNEIGDTFENETKFKTWTPLIPFRKDVLQSSYKVKAPQSSKLKGSKSVDFVDKKGLETEKPGEINFDKFQSKTLFGQRQSWLGSSQCSINSSRSSRRVVPGFGCCFGGDGKTIPYRSYQACHRAYRSHRHSWGPSRSGSRSTLDEDEVEDRGCLSGVVTDDWRAKVVPYMWEGWPVPGMDRLDISKLRERIEQMERMRHEIVNVHNNYRCQHGCPELSVTTELAREAQQWSDILAVRGYAQYSDSQSCGENILVVDIEDILSGRQVVDTWYRESRFYNYKNPCWQRGTSNFSQLIWHTSQFIGVGISKFPYDNTYVIVVQYQPPGNVNTPVQFRRNVPIPIVVKNPQCSENKEPKCEHSIKCEVTTNTPEYQLASNTSESELTNDLSQFYPTSNTPECKATKITSETADNIPNGVVSRAGDLKESSVPPKILFKEDEGNSLECLEDTDHYFKLEENSSSGSCTSLEPSQYKQADDVKELSTAQNGVDNDDVSASLSDREAANSAADLSEDEDDLESSNMFASVSDSHASSLYDGFLNEGQSFELEIIKDENVTRDLSYSLKKNSERKSEDHEFSNSETVTSV